MNQKKMKNFHFNSNYRMKMNALIREHIRRIEKKKKLINN